VVHARAVSVPSCATRCGDGDAGLRSHARRDRHRSEGTLAAYCSAWLDPLARTVEIEPLGTRPEFRRLGIGRAIVDEVVRRAAERDAASVLVWGTGTNPIAVHLYESAGFSSRRVLREYRRAG